MITIVKAIAVGAALSGSPAAHPGNAPSLEAGAPLIRLDQVPTERVLPLAPKTRVAAAEGLAVAGSVAPEGAAEAAAAASPTRMGGLSPAKAR